MRRLGVRGGVHRGVGGHLPFNLRARAVVHAQLPAGVEETHCTERGDSCCVYEVRYRRGSFLGLSLGSVLGMGTGLGLALSAGAAPLAMGLFVFLGAMLGGAAGRAVDLARQLDAVGGARRGQQTPGASPFSI